MKTAVFVCALVALAIGIWAAKVRNGPAAEPSSPQPTVSWTPPRTTIVASYVTTAGLLLGNGLGDPRGRRFCSMSVAMGVADGHPGLSATAYGWVSPDGKSALLLDGVEYGGISQVVPADLGKVVAGLLIDAKEHRPYSSLVLAPAGEYNPALPALLLIANRPDLAEVSYAVCPAASTGDKGRLLASWLYDRYNELVAEDRLGGYNGEGVKDADRLVSVSVVKGQIGPDDGPSWPVESNDSGLNRAKNFAKDFSSKISRHQVGFGDIAGVAALADNERLATLIDGLDTASTLEPMQGTTARRQEVLASLTSLSDQAIPRLIDALASDPRTIRGAHPQGQQTMGLQSGQRFVQGAVTYSGQTAAATVKDAAWSTIQAIWPMCTRWQQSNSNYADPELLRKKWATDANLSVPERWFEVLQDDQAGERLWFQAAENLTKRTSTGSAVVIGETTGGKAPLAGESIRPKHGSEVDSLLAKRCLHILSVSTPNGYAIPNQNECLTLATDLYRWHPAASLECLKAACKCAMVVPKPPPLPPGRPNMPHQPIQYNSSLDGPFAVAVFERSLLGDSSAAADYAAYSTHVPAVSYLNGPPFLAPVWMAPNDAGIQAVGKTLFDRWLKELDGPDANKVMESAQRITDSGELQRLMLVQPFRAMLSQSLAKNRDLGTATAISQGHGSTIMVQFFVGNTPRANWIGSQNDVAPLGKISVSTGDYIASSLSQKFSQGRLGQSVSTFPPFEVYWPMSVRAQAKSSIIEWLNDESRDWPKAVEVLPQFNEDY